MTTTSAVSRSVGFGSVRSATPEREPCRRCRQQTGDEEGHACGEAEAEADTEPETERHSREGGSAGPEHVAGGFVAGRLGCRGGRDDRHGRQRDVLGEADAATRPSAIALCHRTHG